MSEYVRVSINIQVLKQACEKCRVKRTIPLIFFFFFTGMTGLFKLMAGSLYFAGKIVQPRSQASLLPGEVVVVLTDKGDSIDPSK